ncbi:MAG: hypothetical protein APF76_04860 [Desulfitibacter sp. BRH_c19]|nr:MAG: hypothetical protein APF76_04860 [Desulfitibacter sp. BRH_c19]
MGKIVSFWSMKSGWGASSLLALLAHLLSDSNEGKILCVNANYSNKYLDKILNSNNKNTIDDLLVLLKSGDLNRGLLKSFTSRVKGTNIDFISGSEVESHLNNHLKNKVLVSSFFDLLRAEYSLVLLDLNSDISNSILNSCLDCSDVNIAVIKQDKHSILDRIMYLNRTDLRFDYGLINCYDTSLGLLKNEFNALKLWKMSFELPYCSDFLEAINVGNLKAYANKTTDLDMELLKLMEDLIDKYSLRKSNRAQVFKGFKLFKF